MHWTRRILILSCVALPGTWGCATPHDGDGAVETATEVTDAESTSGVSIDVERTLYFQGEAPGAIVTVEPGTYAIEQSGDSSIQLTLPGATPIEVKAQQGEHREAISGSLVLAEESADDEAHIVIMLEDGKTLDAVASYTGIAERGKAAARPILSKQAIAVATMSYSTAQLLPGKTQQASSAAIGEALTRQRVPQVAQRLRLGRLARRPVPPLGQFEAPQAITDASPGDSQSTDLGAGEDGAAELPDSFDLRDRYPRHPEPRSVGSCGSCYLVAPVAVAEWALAIDLQDRGIEAAPTRLSPQAVMDCGTGHSGDFDCNGGWPSDVYAYLEEHGVPLESEYPYNAVDGVCQAYEPQVWLTGWSYASRPQPRDIKNAIYQGRPVTFDMDVYGDFSSYSGGVYRHVSGSFRGKSSMLLIGWGKGWGNESCVDYWLAANIWGRGWGEAGYFKIAVDDVSLKDMRVYYYSGITVSNASALATPP